MKDQVQATFEARIENVEHIYDGDTTNHVFFKLPIQISQNQDGFGEIYPEVFLQPDGVWIHVNLRIAGVDTPERHPRHNYPDGTPRPPAEIAREHELAMRARAEVVRLMEANDLQFEIRNPVEGKYAGRVVGECWIRDPESRHMINLAEHLIDKGLGYPYGGGTKKIWGRD